MEDSSFIELSQSLLRQILEGRNDVALMACQQRAKFEGWLKLELACAYRNIPEVSNVILEGGYKTGGRADIVLKYQGTTWFIEMKTANTNWRDGGVENRSRPIKNNIDGIIEDIQVLQERCSPDFGLSIFALFPIPARIWKSEIEKLDYHLKRVEYQCGLTERSLLQNADYVSIEERFGICTFLVPLFAKR